ncbi:TPA: hemagglutinin repeat-containing protein [Yersinia enterocolitica]
MRKNKFKLSPAGKLATLLSLILTPATMAYAAGIEAAGDSAHRPEISSTIYDVPLINIVAPSVAGLSHNQYQEFNVDQRGVIFNNSQFKVFEGMISARANPNLTGNPASVILNEVVGSNTSTLNGHQQIIGMPADYILVNANGVICNGCSFAPGFENITLAVGAAVIDDGKVLSMSTKGSSAILNIENTDKNTHVADVLTLIAPVINVDGDVLVKDKLSFIVGQNEVGIDTGRLLKSNLSDSLVKTIDGYYLGSIAANRINIIDTRKDNNVNLFSHVFGQELINVDAKGTVRLRSMGKETQRLSGAENIILSGNNLDITRTLAADEKERFNIRSDNYIDNADISGGNIQLLASNNIDLAAVYIKSSDNVYMSADKINIDGDLIERSDVVLEYEPKKQFFGVVGTKQSTKLEKNIPSYSTVSSYGDIKLNGREKINLKGVVIHSDKNMTLFSQGDIHLNGMAGIDKKINRIEYSHWGDDAKTGHDNYDILKETFKPLHIRSNGDINIESKKTIYSHGAQIWAEGGLSIEGQNGVYIGVANMLESRVDRLDYTQHLGIAGSEKDNKDQYHYIANQSELTGNSVYVNSGKDIEIRGSTIKALNKGILSAKGDLTINGMLNKRSFTRDKKTGVIFDITGSSQAVDNKYEKFIDSKLQSGGTLDLHSGKNTYIDGSQVNAGGALNISSNGKVNVQAARQQQKIDEEKTRLSLEWFAKESGDKQYRAGFLVKHQKNSENSQLTENQIATLEGGNINIQADDNVTFFGAAINTTEGDFKLKTSKNVGFFTAKNRAVINKNRVENSGGFYYTAGIDKFGSGAQYTHIDSESHSDIENNLVVKTNINGNLNIDADGDITQQGAQHQVAKNYYTRAVNINNMASHNVDISNNKKLQVDAGFGFNINYKGFTRPIEKAINNPTNALDIIGGVGSQKGVTDPNLGVDITASGSNTKTSNNNLLALVTSIKAQDIKVEATKDVLDEGTQYQAKDGVMKLSAARHFSRAAVNSKEETSQQEKGEASVRVSTTTGKDIKVALAAKAETSQGDSYTEQMLFPNIKAKQGINIRTLGDAYYYATQINGGEGNVDIKAGNNLYFDQVQESTRSSNIKTSGNGKLSVGMSKSSDSSKNFRLEGGGEHQEGESNSTNAGISKITTRGDLRLEAGAELTMKGVQVGSEDARLADVHLVAQGKVNMLASVSGSVDINDKAFADFRLGGKKTHSGSNSSNEGFIGGGGGYDKVNQSISDRQGGEIYSRKTVSIQSGSNSNQAIHMEGQQINAAIVDIKTPNGGVFFESARSELPKENWNFGANLDLVLKRTSGESGGVSKSHYAGSGAKVMVGMQDVIKHQNTRIIEADKFILNTHKDTVMKGARVDTDKAEIIVGGDLHIESLKSKEDSVKVDVEFALSHTNDKGSSVVSKISKIGTKRFEKDIKNALNSGVKKSELMYNQKSSPKDTMGGVSFNKENNNVQLPPLSSETQSRNFADKTARFMGDKFKGAITDPAGIQGRAKLDVQIVNNDAVAEQSGIFGLSDVVIAVKGAAKLHGAQISSRYQTVTRDINGLELSNINNSYHQGGGGFNLSPTALGMATGVGSDAIAGKTPFINNPHNSSHEDKSVGGIVDHKIYTEDGSELPKTN